MVKTEETKKEESKEALQLIDNQEFMLKPKLAMNNDYLSNSITTLTLLL
jgi:hypothetical protein